MNSITSVFKRRSTGVCFKLNRRAFVAGFSLVEMLVVISVIGLIAATTTPMLFSTMKANRLSVAGEEIASRISLAQQLAVSGNHEVELRFYHYIDPDDPTTKDHYRATLIALPAPDPNAPGAIRTTILGELSYLRNGIVVGKTPSLSPTFEETSRADNPDQDKTIPGVTAYYKSIRFFPDGTCDVTVASADAYLTVVEERDLKADAQVPKNFFAIQIDRYTSRVTTYRP